MSSLYSYSLCAALPLMLFFGFYFLLGRTPEKAIFENYLRSRRIMGAAMLLLAANYSVHFFMKVRFNDADAAILINLTTYFLCYWLFSSALTTLLDRNYITRRRLLTHISLWILFSVISCIILKLLPEGTAQTVAILALAVWLVVYGLFLTWRLLRTYHRVIRIFNETHADDIGAYIKWLSVFTYWAVIFGVGCGLLTFLPDKYVYIWILMSIPFYIYLFLCYLNYMLFSSRWKMQWWSMKSWIILRRSRCKMRRPTMPKSRKESRVGSMLMDTSGQDLPLKGCPTNFIPIEPISPST